MKLDSDDFELFGLPRQFEQDRAALSQRWRTLQGEVHPDRFVAQGAAAQRLAMQWAVRVNEAHQRLKDPIQRASLLCELAGFAVDAERNTAMPAEFLMQQMAWREALDEASTAVEVQALADEVTASQKDQLGTLAALIDEQHDFGAAVAQIRALMFVARFAQDIAQRLDHLET